MTIVWAYSTDAPFSTRIAVTTPSIGEATWFISFITSTIATVSPAATVCPTSTKGGAPGEGERQNRPTEGDSIRVPFANVSSAAPLPAPPSSAGDAVGGT